jgi:hypothetical protein
MQPVEEIILKGAGRASATPIRANSATSANSKMAYVQVVQHGVLFLDDLAYFFWRTITSMSSILTSS